MAKLVGNGCKFSKEIQRIVLTNNISYHVGQVVSYYAQLVDAEGNTVDINSACDITSIEPNEARTMWAVMSDENVIEVIPMHAILRFVFAKVNIPERYQ